MESFNEFSTKQPCIEAIPQGLYCYDGEGVCPYWSIQDDKPAQENGYCHFLQKGDGHFDGESLLWDQCKECNIFPEINEYEWSIKNNAQRFFKKLSLFSTIPKCYNTYEKIRIVFTGQICLCKFCKKYFIQPQGARNLTQCVPCFLKKVQQSQNNQPAKV